MMVNATSSSSSLRAAPAPGGEELRGLYLRHPEALLAASYGAEPEHVVDHAVRAALTAEAIVGVRRGEELRAATVLSRAALDQEIYGRGMGELRHLLADGDYGQAREALGELLEAAWREAHQRGISHLNATVSVDDVAARHALEDAGFRLMDTRCEYMWTPALVRAEKKPYGFLLRAAADAEETAEAIRLVTLGAVVRPFQPEDLPALQDIAAEAFTQRTRTRYTVDPSLPLADTARLYSRWVENAATGAFGDLTVVAELDGAPIGFQILRIERALGESIGVQIGAMGIGAVVADNRGSGAFPALVTEILTWCRERKLRFARGGVLVNNVRMHRSCMATGGTIAACYHAFHGHRPLS